MDRFKFRVWNSINGQWLHLYEKLGGCSLYGETMLLGGWLDGVCLSDLDKIIIEQCTGLKDKNGKLIYEGDIVECWFLEVNLRYVNVISTDEALETWEGFSGSELQQGEGDDVWLHSHHHGNVVWSASPLSPGFEVDGSHGVWYDEMGTLFSFEDCEIIGNIHENPELING